MPEILSAPTICERNVGPRHIKDVASGCTSGRPCGKGQVTGVGTDGVEYIMEVHELGGSEAVLNERISEVDAMEQI